MKLNSRRGLWGLTLVVAGAWAIVVSGMGVWEIGWSRLLWRQATHEETARRWVSESKTSRPDFKYSPDPDVESYQKMLAANNPPVTSTENPLKNMSKYRVDPQVSGAGLIHVPAGAMTDEEEQRRVIIWAARAFIPPLGILLLFWPLMWVASGFRNSPRAGTLPAREG